MSKLWEKSNCIEFDNNGEVADGAIATFFVGGTTTPLSVYEDAAETTPHDADGVETDANGRWPNVFIPFIDSYDVRVRTEGGTQLYYPTRIPNPDPVEAAADTADPEELIATGHVHWEPIQGTKTGFVRLNGRTIGDASSGATERANADTSDLFTYLWNALANGQAAVSTGRGASAAADFAAHKTLTLLDGRSGVLRGLDDMGNSAASRLGSTTFTNGNATTPGSALGANSHALITAELAQHLHSVSITTDADGAHSHTLSAGTVDSASHSHASVTITDPSHRHHVAAAASSGTIPVGANDFVARTGSASGQEYTLASTGTEPTVGLTDAQPTGITASVPSGGAHSHTLSGSTAAVSTHTHLVSGNTGNNGSGTAHNNVSYGLLGTFYCKL